MRKAKFLTIAVILTLLLLIPAAADELELGMSLTPIGTEGEDNPDPEAEDTVLVLPGFHIGYRFAGIGFVSWDSYVMPPELITLMTAVYDSKTDQNTLGPFRPGFLNTWNIGAKLIIGPLVGYSTIGINNIYVYKQAEYPDEEFDSSFGTNWKVGAGWKFGDWGINLDFMAIFSSADTMFSEIDLLFSGNDDEQAAAKEKIQFIPSLVATLYL